VIGKLRRQKPPQEETALDPVMARRARVGQATLAAVQAYFPRRFPGRVHLFIPSKAWRAHWTVAAERWRSVAGHAEAYFGPGCCTNDNMLLTQYAPAFAELFRYSCEPFHAAEANRAEPLALTA
jgi:hypothetical protein